MNALGENLNSDYIKAFSWMQPKKAPQRILVYVESLEDISFWYPILQSFEQEALKFEINLPSNDKIKILRGKTNLLIKKDQLGTNLILCLDSDFDYLLPDRNIHSVFINHSPFVLQTYTHSIENYKCEANSLKNICILSTNLQTETLDWNSFFREYSQNVYPLFLWFLFFYQNDDLNTFTLTEFCKIIKLPKAKIEDSFVKFSKKVSDKIRFFEENFHENLVNVNEIAADFTTKGLVPETTYLFLHGHTVFENTQMLLETECHRISNQYINTIKQTDVLKAEKLNNIKHFNNQKKEIKTVLELNQEFENNFLFAKISLDLKKIFTFNNS